MSRNGSGSYSAPGASFPAVTGTVIDSSKYNSVVNDIGAEITNSIAADGQTVPTNNIQMGGHKITNLASGTVSGDAVQFSQLATYAPLASPAFTGIPTAPTAVSGTADTSLATTNFVERRTSSVSVSIGGGVDATLGINVAVRQYITLTGVLTASINVILPTVARWWIINDQTTGAFTTTIKYATGTGITIPLSKGSILLYGDGTNILDGLSIINNAKLNGIPTAATAAAATNNTQVATTAYADGLKTQNETITGIKTFSGGSEPVSKNITKAWAMFDGTVAGTNAPTVGFGVTSITRNGLGDYTINWSSSQPTANYCVVITAQGTDGTVNCICQGSSGTAPTTTAYRFRIVNPGVAFADSVRISFVMYGA
jgi:hypothetical protein